MDWLDKRDTDKPFMTMLWFSEPHTPVLASDEFQAIYDTDEARAAAAKLKFGGPQVARKPADAKMKLYFGCVTMLDYHIGRLLDYLDKKQLSDNTIVVFTSDNGPEHRTPTCFGSPGGLRGAKGHMHEGGYRVPGIIRWPGVIERGSTSAEPVNGTDFLPSLATAAGIKFQPTKQIDGANVFPALLHDRKVDRPKPMVWWLWHARGGKEVTMRHGDYKILANMLPQASPGDPRDTKQPDGMSIMDFIKKSELGNFTMYNLAKDPNETTELSKAEPERLKELSKMLIDVHAEIRAEGPVYELGGGRKPRDKTKKKK
jgi:arylsulfatase A